MRTSIFFLKTVRYKNITIGLARKFCRFFQSFYFTLFLLNIKLVFNDIYSVAIYNLSTTLWQRKDSAFVKVLRFLAEEVSQIHFETAFIIELFLTQVIGERSKQMMVSRSQVWRVSWMGDDNPP